MSISYKDFYENGLKTFRIYYSNGTGLTNLSYIGTDDEESAYPAAFTRQLTRLKTPYHYDPDPNNIMGDWYRYLVNDLYGIPKKEEIMKTAQNYTVKKIIYNPPATIVFWEDGSKTVVKCSKDDEYSPYFGFLAALAKKVYGNPSRVRKVVDKWAPEEEEQYYKFTIRIKFATNSLTDTNQEQYMVVTDFMETYKNTIGKRLWVCSDLIKTVSTNGGEVEIVAESPKPLSIDEKLYIQYAVERDLEEFYAVSDVDITSCPIEKKDDKE